MKEFLFKEKSGQQRNFSVVTDLIDPNADIFTFMEFKGDKTAQFWGDFPWKLGDVMTKVEFCKWAIEAGMNYDCVVYWNGGSNAETLVQLEFATLTLVPTIINGNVCGIKVNNRNIDVTNGTNTELEVIVGEEYTITLVSSGSWTDGSAPEAFTIEGDVTKNIKVTLTNDSTVRLLTITPAFVGLSEASIKFIGTKSGYVNDVIQILGMDTSVITRNVKDGYTYTCEILNPADANWTSGSAPTFTVNGSDVNLEVAITKESIPEPTETPATPVITSSNGDVFTSNTLVTIACETDGASIYYTMNGNTPSESSTSYTTPFQLSWTATIKAIAIKNGVSSEVASKYLVLNGGDSE